jgi:hypothetical protein
MVLFEKYAIEEQQRPTPARFANVVDYYFNGKNMTLLAVSSCVQQWATNSRSETSLPMLTF